MDIAAVFFAAELIGVAAFAVTGVSAAVTRGLDVFGALILGCLTACGGGLMRDLLIGQTPPVLFTDPIYVSVAAGVSLAAFVAAAIAGRRIKRHIAAYNAIVNVFDAVGLAVFVIVGVNSAAAAGYGDNAFLAISVGVLTGVGGGMLRDVLAGQVPVILRKRVYAVAAVLGAVVYYFGERAGLPDWATILAGALLIIVIRILATVFRWNLPVIHNDPDGENGENQ